MTKPTTTLAGRKLSRSFGDGQQRLAVLHGTSLELCRRELALLMGPSGSGKTTLLAVLSGLLRPDRGEVMALGQNLWEMSEQEREWFRLQHCGFVFQGYNLFPSLTVRQQLEMVLRWGENVSDHEAQARTAAMLAVLGLSDKREMFPGDLSGGEKQRVAVGRALIKDPTFCFADEPTAALDWAHGQQIVELLQQVAHERDGTVLVVAHDHRIIPFADRVFYLEDGCLTEQEPKLPVQSAS
ncbi:MAG: ABC transporter ATP-binding protein [Gemmataceae bacterium]